MEALLAGMKLSMTYTTLRHFAAGARGAEHRDLDRYNAYVKLQAEVQKAIMSGDLALINEVMAKVLAI